MNVLRCILFPDIQIMRNFKIVRHVDINSFEEKTLQKTKQNKTPKNSNNKKKTRKKVSKTQANNSGSFEKSASAPRID